MKFAVGITGASGVILGYRLARILTDQGHEVFLIASEGAQKVARAEGAPDLSELAGAVAGFYAESDMEAPLASSSFLLDGMAICPCSMKTLSAVANAFSDNLITRAAENCLKMSRTLALVPRDTPLSLPSLENMVRVKRAGALVVPPTLGFYSAPRTVEDLIDFVIGKVLDCLGVPHNLYRRWGGDL